MPQLAGHSNFSALPFKDLVGRIEEKGSSVHSSVDSVTWQGVVLQLQMIQNQQH